jgi:thiamine pyrophosphokinase
LIQYYPKPITLITIKKNIKAIYLEASSRNKVKTFQGIQRSKGKRNIKWVSSTSNAIKKAVSVMSIHAGRAFVL